MAPEVGGMTSGQASAVNGSTTATFQSLITYSPIKKRANNMAGRLPPVKHVADLLQRGIVTSLFGLTIYGVYVGWDVHTTILRRGQGT